ncbi:MAG: translation initiation factor IF-6 [Nitrososphaerota archaeon]
MRAGRQEVMDKGIYVEEFFGTPEVGLFAVVTENICIVPPQLKPRQEKLISTVFEVEVVKTTIAGSYLIGPLVAGNSYGLVISKLALEEEVEKIRSIVRDLNILLLESVYTAAGNLILTNDRAALVSTYFSKKEVKMIEDTLNVEIVQGMIAQRPYVGSISVVTNNGGLIHVESTEEEVKSLSKYFKVEFFPGTVNDGVKFVRSGIIANSRGAVVGARTTGPELMVISRALGV